MVMGMARLINYFELKQRILEERDKIPRTLPGAYYELGIEKPNHHGNSMRGGIRIALRCLEQCQTVMDVVEVVRCKDCKYKFSANGHNKNGCPLDGAGLMNDDDFCSYGERKDNE
jgi:hypothetical protein